MPTRHPDTGCVLIYECMLHRHLRGRLPSRSGSRIGCSYPSESIIMLNDGVSFSDLGCTIFIYIHIYVWYIYMVYLSIYLSIDRSIYIYMRERMHRHLRGRSPSRSCWRIGCSWARPWGSFILYLKKDVSFTDMGCTVFIDMVCTVLSTNL